MERRKNSAKAPFGLQIKEPKVARKHAISLRVVNEMELLKNYNQTPAKEMNAKNNRKPFLRNGKFFGNDAPQNFVEDRGGPTLSDVPDFYHGRGQFKVVASDQPDTWQPQTMPSQQHWGLKQIPTSERPREKMVSAGPAALSDAELLALLISSGTTKASAIDLSRQLLDQVGGIMGLGHSQIEDLISLDGIGNAKASIIVAAFELGRRHMSANKHRTCYNSPVEIADYLRPQMAHYPHEVFRVIAINKANSILAERDMFTGGIASTIVDPVMIFKFAIQHHASKLILCHNHPSGSCKPSTADYDITDRLVRIGETMGIKVVDHIIVSGTGFYSFADNQIIRRIQEDQANLEKSSKSSRNQVENTYESDSAVTYAR